MGLYSTSSDYAKDTWLPVYPNQLQNAEGTWLKQLGLSADSRVKIEGRNAYMKVQVGDDLGFSVLAEGGDFGDPGDIASDEATLSLMRFSDTIKFTSHEKALLDSLTAAAAPIMQKKMSASQMRVQRELERMSIMNGSGKLAKHASDSSTTITLDVSGTSYEERNPYTWLDDPNRSRYSLIASATGADVTQGWTISSIVRSTNVITTSATQTSGTAGDFIVTDYGTSAWTSGGSLTSREMVGLLGMITDDNTYMGIDRTTASLAFWQATVADNGGTLRDISEDVVDQFLNRVMGRSESGVLVPSEYIATASPGVWTEYHRLMTSGIRYSVSETPDIGWGGRPFIPMEGIPLYKHVKSPRHQIMLVHKNSAKFIGPKHDQSEVFKFLDNNGSIFFQANASSGTAHSDATYAYIVGWLGLYTERPRNHGRLDDLNESLGDYVPSSY